MKRLFALWISAIFLVVGSFSFAQYTDSTYIKNDSINTNPGDTIPFNNGDSTFIDAHILQALKIYLVPFSETMPDSIQLTVQEDNNPSNIITLNLFVDRLMDTTVYLRSGVYKGIIHKNTKNLINVKFADTKKISSWYPFFGDMNIDFYLPERVNTCGSRVKFDVKINNPQNLPVKYEWTPSLDFNNDTIRNPEAVLHDSGTEKITYKVKVTVDSQRILTDSVNVFMAPLTCTVGLDKQIICGTSLPMFVATNYNGKGNMRFKWSPSEGLDNDTIRFPTCSATKTTTYTMVMTTPEGCTVSDQITISFAKSDPMALGIVTVNSNKKNVIAWNKPMIAGIQQYYIYKESNVTDVYTKIGSVHGDSLSVFVDTLSNADIKSNRYKISYLNACNAETDLSAYHKTMHLAINKGQGNTYNLIWEPYQGFTVNTYNIYRGSSLNALGFMDATAGSSTQYTDLDAPSGDIYYQLEVISPNLVSPTKVTAENRAFKAPQISYNSSRSNVAARIVSGLSDLEIENQMTVLVQPDGQHIELITSLESFNYQIFNMVGQLVNEGSNDKLISISSLQSGVHAIRIQIGEKLIQKKFVKK